MSGSVAPELPLVSSVLHPTDFSEASELAFAHALAIALVRQTKFTVLHVGSKGRKDRLWSRFPSVRETLERWGLLEPGSPRSAVYDQLNLRVKKVAVGSDDPVAAIVDFVREKPCDLMVLGTRGREGMPGWIRRSVSEPVARRTQTMTLFVPAAGRGFVSPEDGSFSLRRILIPVDHEPRPNGAIEFATRAARALGRETVGITLLHVGESAPPEIDLPEDPAWSWSRIHRTGSAIEEIVKSAAETSANLIAMVTAGHEGILDALRGSTTERVLREAPCPVLAVPASRVDEAVRIRPG